MDEIVADYPKARLKVILDNLNTHKKNDEWLKRQLSRNHRVLHFLDTRGRPQDIPGMDVGLAPPRRY
jgi:hypothetical protein